MSLWSQQLVPLTDADGRLRGVLSDGDVRRAILRGESLDGPASAIMNDHPLTMAAGHRDRGRAIFLLRERRLRWLPIVDDDGGFVELWTLEDLLRFSARGNLAVIMAGGLGTRMAPLTDTMPKPMLPVGGRPLLEHIVDQFVRQGFRSIVISVAYRKEIIERHFGDGAGFGADIRYLHEDRRLGTAGALSLLPEPPDAPVVVMNGDILATLDFGALIDAHDASGAAATMVVRRHEERIPFGVAAVNDARELVSLEEKPVLSFLVSAGINVLSPEAVARIPKGEFFDMPDLHRELLRDGRRVLTWETEGYWRDVGNLKEYRQANRDMLDSL